MNKSTINLFLDSTYFRIFVFLLGLASFFIKVIEVSLPNFLNGFINISLCFFGLYFLIIIIRALYMPLDERVFQYQSKRYGMGYESLIIQCEINKDGSAEIIRDVKIVSWSELSEVDTYMKIINENPQEVFSDIEVGIIKSYDKHSFWLEVTKKQPGMVQANIKISPPLKSGERTNYHVNDYKLSKGLFGIDITNQELRMRGGKPDFYGWHINRPTRTFKLQVLFPPERIPSGYWEEVKYAASAGNPSERTQYKEQEKIKNPELKMVGGRYYLILEVDYPITGLMYILNWKPITKEE